jgi:signal transduction histidine kinase/CheY-like chemotaxis protein
VTLRDLVDLGPIQRLAEANYRASGMPIGIVDAVDGAVLVGVGWQDICTRFHRVHPGTSARCRESDDFIKAHLSDARPCEYTCQNGLRDIGIPIRVEGEHLATLFMGQFFYEGEAPDRGFFVEQARRVGFEEGPYLAALDRVPVFSRAAVENILAYNAALAAFLGELGATALRRQRAEARAESLARFPQENPAPVLRLTGPDGAVSYANAAARAALRELGVEPGGPAPARIAELARRAVAERAPVAGEVTADGRVFALAVTATGDDVSVYGHDITDRKRLERELRDANRLKDEFLGMLSHELRNPLAPIRNALYILDHADAGSPQARRAKEVAGRQLAHLSRIVDDLLDVTRIARGKIELRRARLDLGALVRRTGEDHRSLMRDGDLAFSIQVPPEPVWVDGDETRLAQAIGNLLGNAAKFTPAGGRVELAAVPDGAAAEIRVRDTGAGMDPELLDRVFDPFVQARQSLARSEGGLGLGLALVKGFVEQHGGSVRAASAGPGRGSEFTIRLQRLGAGAGAPRAAPGRDAEQARALRVVVVDDNRDAAESLADVVRMLGHEVEVAFDGESAIEAVRARPPDLVLCDIGLPGLSGYQVAEALRADRRLDGVRLVAVSGYARPEDRQRALDAGFADHLAKPADPDRVLRLLAAPRTSSAPRSGAGEGAARTEAGR